MSVIIVALILCQTITLMTVSGIIVVSLADALLVWTAVSLVRAGMDDALFNHLFGKTIIVRSSDAKRIGSSGVSTRRVTPRSEAQSQ